MAPAGEHNVIVVGSGFGGAVAACRLAQAGIPVTLLERGRRYEAEDFPALPTQSALLPDFARWMWQADRGLWDVEDLEELVSVQAAGFGGGSLIYANVHLRPPREIFDDRWPAPYADADPAAPHALDAYYDLAASMLNVSPLPARAADSLAKVDQLRKSARALAREEAFFLPPLAINFEEGTPDQDGAPRKACTLCGGCSTGCTEGAKNSLDRNYLAIAEKHGARVLTLCEVQQLAFGESGWCVRYRDHALDVERQLEGTEVFLCAGALHSSRLLSGVKVARKHVRIKPQQGKAEPGVSARAPSADPETALEVANVGIGYYPNADAVGVVYDTQHEQRPSRGPTIASSIVHANGADAQGRASFFMIQDGGYPPALARALGTLRGGAWLSRNRVTRAGDAKIEPPDAAASPATNGSRVEALAAALPSIVDAALAYGGDLWRGETGHWLRSLFRPDEQPWLTPVVQGTIERSVHAQTERLRVLSSVPFGRRVLEQLVARAIEAVAGSSQTIAEQAFRALLAGYKLQKILGYDDDAAERRTLLLAMGRDSTPGVLHFEHGRAFADLDLYHLAPLYLQEEFLMADIAEQLGGELRLNPAWSYLGKPITVHGQGGCRMSDDPRDGVVDPNGKVHGAVDPDDPGTLYDLPGLYVLDGSILCTSVGVNPSSSILAIAERNVLAFIRTCGEASWPEPQPGERLRHPEGAAEYRQQQQAARDWAARAARWNVRPPAVRAPRPARDREPVGIRFRETMRGFYSVVPPEKAGALWFPESTPNPADNAGGDLAYRKLAAGPARRFLSLELEVGVGHLSRFLEDAYHRLAVGGLIRVALPGCEAPEDYAIEAGELQLFVPRYKDRALDEEAAKTQERVTGVPYMSWPKSEERRSRTHFMIYRLPFRNVARGESWELQGYKRIRQDPGFDAFRDTTQLFVRLIRHGSTAGAPASVRGGGRVQLGAVALRQQLATLTTTGADGLVERAWAYLTFANFFFGTLQQVYAPKLGALRRSFFGSSSSIGAQG